MSHKGVDDLTREEALAFFWSTWWRGAIVTLGGAASGAVVGVIGSVVLVILRRATNGAVEVPYIARAIIELPIVFAISLYLVWQGWRWIFRINLAGYRLRLVRIQDEL